MGSNYIGENRWNYQNHQQYYDGNQGQSSCLYCNRQGSAQNPIGLADPNLCACYVGSHFLIFPC